MSRKIAVAVGFRHNPKEDGAFIPASEVIAAGPRENYGIPVIGYMAYLPKGSQNVFWGFVKYVPPEAWEPEWRRPCVRGQMATSRVARFHCGACGQAGYMPISGNGARSRCPDCNQYGLDLEIVKESSGEFRRLLGDLRDPLEQACRAAASTGLGFEYPQVLVTARGLEVSSSVPAQYARKISEAGFGVQDIREMDGFQSMLDLHYLDPALSIVPDIASGVVDEDDAMRGISRIWPVFSTWLKLWLPQREKPREQVQFRTVRI